MKSQEIQDKIYQWAVQANFTAPYGVLTGEHVNAKTGKKYKSVTFGYARTLDATVDIYNERYCTFRSNRHGYMPYLNKDELFSFLNETFQSEVKL